MHISNLTTSKYLIFYLKRQNKVWFYKRLYFTLTYFRNPIVKSGAHFGEGTGEQYVIKHCSGSESTINSCSVSSASGLCGSHAKDVSVICSKYNVVMKKQKFSWSK